jgi:hypothetical protein
MGSLGEMQNMLYKVQIKFKSRPNYERPGKHNILIINEDLHYNILDQAIDNTRGFV